LVTIMIESAGIDHIIKSGQALYSTYESPVGKLLIIGTDSRLMSIVFSIKHTNRHPLEKKLIKGVNHSITACRSYLDYFFNRTSAEKKNALFKQSVRYEKRSSLLYITSRGGSLTIDCSLFTPNECMVYDQLIKVPFGSTVSYGDLARRSGFPGGARFIGNTMAKNMVPIIIPCHRVIRNDGSIGNYSGGIHIKEYLLNFENNSL